MRKIVFLCAFFALKLSFGQDNYDVNLYNKHIVNAVTLVCLNDGNVVIADEIYKNMTGKLDSIYFVSIGQPIQNNFIKSNRIKLTFNKGMFLDENLNNQENISGSFFNGNKNQFYKFSAYYNDFIFGITNGLISTYTTSWTGSGKDQYKRKINKVQYNSEDQIAKIEFTEEYAKGKSIKSKDLKITHDKLIREVQLTYDIKEDGFLITKETYKFAYPKKGDPQKTFDSKITYKYTKADNVLVSVSSNFQGKVEKTSTYAYKDNQIKYSVGYNSENQREDSCFYTYDNKLNFVSKMETFKLSKLGFFINKIEDFSYNKIEATTPLLGEKSYKQNTFTTTFNESGEEFEQYEGTKKRRKINGEWGIWQQMIY